MFHLPPTALPGAALPWDRWRGPLPGDHLAVRSLPWAAAGRPPCRGTTAVRPRTGGRY